MAVSEHEEVMEASMAGDLSKLKLLFSRHQYDPSTKAAVLKGAASKGHENMVQFLLSMEPAVEVDSDTAYDAAWGGLPVYKLLHSKHPDIISWSFGSLGDVAHCAIRSRNKSLLRYVLDHGADPGKTLVCYRFFDRFTPIEDTALVSDDPEILQILLENGATLDQTDALNISAQFGRLQLARLLLDAGVPVNHMREPTDLMYNSSQIYCTPLHNAVRQNHIEMVELLLQHGADPGLESTDGKTAWYEAQMEGNREVLSMFQLYTALDSNRAQTSDVNKAR